MSETNLVIVETEATKSKICVALDKQGILLATIKYPRLPIWYADEIELLNKDFDTITYKFLNMINNLKKIFDGSKIVEYEYIGKKEEKEIF